MSNIPLFATRREMTLLLTYMFLYLAFTLLTLYAKPSQDIVVMLLLGIRISEWPGSGKQPGINTKEYVIKHMKKNKSTI